MDKTNIVFQLFTTCKIVIGATRSIICDLQRGEFDFIPNDLGEIIQSHVNMPISQIKCIYGGKSDKEIDEYFNFLIEKEYGFWRDENDKDLFPEINLKWSAPSLITNSIIDVGNGSNHNFEKIFSELEALGCKDVQVRFFCETSEAFIENLFLLIKHSRIKSVELLIKNGRGLNFETLKKLTQRYTRIRNIIVHSASEFNLALIDKINGRGNIIYVKDKITSSSHCGGIFPSGFIINLPMFLESQNYNTCLNGKISIDIEGNIKNCPSLNTSFGNLKEISLTDATLKDHFKNTWGINKDKIETCKDCEFRHICTDCRAYVENPDDIYSKPLKCGYNPYKNEWEEWSTNPLKQKAMETYQL